MNIRTTLLIGKTIDVYLVMEHIGSGYMGSVYKARDVHLQIDVAVKLISPILIHDVIFLNRFLREARAMAQCKHKNIVSVIGFRETEYGPLIVMEYVDGESLKEFIQKKGSLTLDEALPIYQQILAGTDHAHKNRVYHRDLKPANIMVTRTGEVKITDFGLARVLDETKLTKWDFNMGTLPYMSPEQLTNFGQADHLSDIYSLGIILYEMLVGRVPFLPTDNREIIYAKIMEGNLLAPTRYNPDIPGPLVDIYRKAVNKIPKKRFQSVEEMLSVIESFERDNAKIEPAPVPVPKPHPPRPVPVQKFAKIAFTLMIIAAMIIGINKLIPIINKPPVNRQFCYVVSHPDGASIMLDGEFKGNTPTNLEVEKPGAHEIVLEMAGLKPIRQTIPYTSTSVDTLQFAFRGVFRLESNPENALIILKDDSINSPYTPYVLDWPLDRDLTIEMQLAGYKSIKFSGVETILPDSSMQKRFWRFNRIKGQIDTFQVLGQFYKEICVNSKPPAAEIYLDDGADTGYIANRDTIPFTLGRHLLKLRQSGFLYRNIEVTIDENFVKKNLDYHLFKKVWICARDKFSNENIRRVEICCSTTRETIPAWQKLGTTADSVELSYNQTHALKLFKDTYLDKDFQVSPDERNKIVPMEKRPEGVVVAVFDAETQKPVRPVDMAHLTIWYQKIPSITFNQREHPARPDSRNRIVFGNIDANGTHAKDISTGFYEFYVSGRYYTRFAGDFQILDTHKQIDIYLSRKRNISPGALFSYD